MRMTTPLQRLTVDLPCLRGYTGYLSPKDAKAMRTGELEDVCFEIILVLTHEG